MLLDSLRHSASKLVSLALCGTKGMEGCHFYAAGRTKKTFIWADVAEKDKKNTNLINFNKTRLTVCFHQFNM